MFLPVLRPVSVTRLLRATHNAAAAVSRSSTNVVPPKSFPGTLTELKSRLEVDHLEPSLQDFIENSPAIAAGANYTELLKPVKDLRGDRPPWLKGNAPRGKAFGNLKRLKRSTKKLGLATVCEEAQCPNIGECWGGEEGTATATIMLLGDTCTRGCRFCAVKTSRKPPAPDPEEPHNVSTAIAQMGVDYIVLTVVDRDDLPDGGAAHIAQTLTLLGEKNPELKVEALVGDFGGSLENVATVAASGLQVFAHNVETVPRLQRYIRDHRANWDQSIRVLETAKATRPSVLTKTSIMLGLGETDDEVQEAMELLRQSDVDVVTFGQYLQPSNRHLPVEEYVTPEKFAKWQEAGMSLGFKYVASGPLVRSSYRAGEFYMKGIIDKAASKGTTAPAAAVL